MRPASRWAVVTGAGETWRRFRADVRAIPGGAWRRWGAILAIGLVACGAASVGITILGRSWVANRGLQAWDERWLLTIADVGPMSFPDAILAESPGNLSYLIPLTLAVAVIAVRCHRPLVAVTILVSYWGVRPVVLAGWMTWDRGRPKLIADGLAAPGLHSFPSGHAALAIAVYGFLAYLWIRQSRSLIERTLAVLLTAAWVTMVSVARVRLGSHWPSDIVSGAVIGVLWLAVVIVAFRYAEKRRVIASVDRG